ncbi:hypothetical protein L228DRAFT_47784 [Xylona heveae TC161]|uniref:Uncharacterized protein n=1 Tax=Xylona heveae (strain CBS 132557 / TC161) TaxID=1328760 RepID=A0A164ZJF8_XYLHT|nr:hypothetical protein L228DRAFT_47784 [Xylona heveae TC161]KZF19174.1 hypothetical protein L228DRAFT_47784 [Xylona heveae TC161]
MPVASGSTSHPHQRGKLPTVRYACALGNCQMSKQYLITLHSITLLYLPTITILTSHYTTMSHDLHQQTPYYILYTRQSGL